MCAAAAAAKSLQSCPTMCDPREGSSPIHSPGKNTGVGCHFLLQCMKVKRESEEELKSFLMKVKEESANVGLKLNIQKTKIMALGPISSWEIDGETVETVSDFILGGSKITADGNCNHEIKRCLLLGRKVIPT